MKKRIPLGIDDFRQLRRGGMEYVDKSLFIRDLIDKGAQALLFPRPRRFGKTLNMSMLRCFFEKGGEDTSPLFEDLAIWTAGDEYRSHFRRHPVISLTFKDVKQNSYAGCWAAIKAKLGALFDEHRGVLESGRLTDLEVSLYREVLERRAADHVYEWALGDLCRYLALWHGEEVVVLIDEYDAPLHSAYLNGFAHELVPFFRGFLSSALKGNAHLYKGVLTGILRIAKESIFSGLNNVIVYSVLHNHFSPYFGFTEPEVESLLARADRSGSMTAVRAYYNGYLFGQTPIYNPWSILKFVDDGNEYPEPHWVNTSSNDLIHEVLRRQSFRIQGEIETLLDGGSIDRDVDENVALSDIVKSTAAFWSLLVFSGYLRAEVLPRGAAPFPKYRLTIPNLEVRGVYTSTFQAWMRERMDDKETGIDRLKTALLTGDAPGLEACLQEFTASVLSYHDVALPGAPLVVSGASPVPVPRPEQVYHAFVIGLLATLDAEFEVRSNRESGHGRPDVMIRPRNPGVPGVVMELKVAKPGTRSLTSALSEGLSQIRENDYAAELRAAGVPEVHAFAVAFDGKRVQVRLAGAAVEKASARSKVAARSAAKAVKKGTSKKSKKS